MECQGGDLNIQFRGRVRLQLTTRCKEKKVVRGRAALSERLQKNPEVSADSLQLINLCLACEPTALGLKVLVFGFWGCRVLGFQDFGVQSFRV